MGRAIRTTALGRGLIGAALIGAVVALGVDFATPAAANGPIYGHGLLWRVQPAGGPPSHVFGTIHMADERVRTLPEPVREAFAGAGSLTLEVERTPDMPLRVARLMMLRSGESLSGIVGQPLFDKTVAAAVPFGVPAAVLERFKPWAAFVAFSVPASERERQAQGQMPLDHMLQAKAEARGLPVHSLESIEEQLGVFDSLSRRDQVDLLRYMVEEADNIDSVTEQVMAFYIARDIGGLMEWMARQMTGDNARLHAAYTDRLLNGRNVTMARRMAPMLQKGGAFIAVGAAHLPGEHGILKLLADKGYKVTRLY